MNIAYNVDCVEYMATLPDKAFDLAVVDPPYGIEKGFSATSRIAKYGQMESVNDQKPNKEYFEQLFRVSKNQIVFGYNHLSNLLPPTKEFLFWYKHQPVDTYSDGELAWTSFKKLQNVSISRFSVGSERIRTDVFIPPKSQSLCTCGFIDNTLRTGIKYWTHIWGVGQAV